MSDTNSLPRCAICGDANGIMDRNVTDLSIVRGPGQRAIWTVMACERCAVSLVERQHALQALRGKYAGVLPSVDEYVEEKRAESPAPKLACEHERTKEGVEEVKMSNPPLYRCVKCGAWLRIEKFSRPEPAPAPKPESKGTGQPSVDRSSGTDPLKTGPVPTNAPKPEPAKCEHIWAKSSRPGYQSCVACAVYRPDPPVVEPEPAPARECTEEQQAEALRRALRSARAQIRGVYHRDLISDKAEESLIQVEAEIDAALRGEEGT